MVSYAIPTSGALITNYNVGTVVTPAQAAAAPAAGLTEIATATVSGGAVSSLSITVNLEAGKSYRFGWGRLRTTANAGRVGINSNTTTTSYRRGYFTSGATNNDDSDAIATGAGAGEIVCGFGLAGLLNSTPVMTDLRLNQDSANRGAFQGHYHPTETTVDTIELFSITGNALDNGTWLTCWRLD